jgi:hypothetical protein
MAENKKKSVYSLTTEALLYYLQEKKKKTRLSIVGDGRQIKSSQGCIQAS